MQIVIKTLKKEEFTFTVEPSDTVLDLKKQIGAQQGHEPELQKLIFSGKILANEQTLGSYGIQEGNFMVLMVGKKPATSAAAPTATPTTSVTTGVPSSQPTPSPTTTTTTTTTPTTTTTTGPTTTPATVPSTPPSTPVSTELSAEMEAKVEQLTSMGFPREQSLQALRVAQQNVSRAT